MIITIKRQEFSGRPADKQLIIDRSHRIHKNTCAFCGFEAKKHQRLVYLDGNEDNVAEKNIKLACFLCHAGFYGGMVDGTAKGTLIVLPQIPQYVISQICHGIYALEHGEIENFKLIKAGKEILSSLKRLEKLTENNYGFGAEQPHVIYDLLAKVNKKSYGQRHRFVGCLRFLPDKTQFKPEIKWSSKKVYSYYDFHKIEAIYKKLIEQKDNSQTEPNNIGKHE